MLRTCRWIATTLRRRLAPSTPPGPTTPRKRPTRLRLEPLEDRTVPTAVAVTNLTDVVNGDTANLAALAANNGGDGISLREALTAANNTAGSDTITFQAGLNGMLHL